jgi:hypothetical protein
MIRRRNELVHVPPLPETSADLRDSVSLDPNDEVHRMLKDGLYAEVKPYLEAVQDQAAITKKVMFDRAIAASIVKKYAASVNNMLVANLSEWAIDHALGVAMRRMNIGRNQRLRLASSSS